MIEPSNQHAESWLHAARDPRVIEGLEAIFERAAQAIAVRGPACWASGRCCNFDAAGHRLYATGLEAAYCLLRAGTVSERELQTALARGGCPYQVLNLCGAHGHKPIGCRIYFCDRSAQSWQNELYETLLGDLRALHDAHQLAYVYAEWRQLLGAMLAEPSALKAAGAPSFAPPQPAQPLVRLTHDHRRGQL